MYHKAYCDQLSLLVPSGYDEVLTILISPDGFTHPQNLAGAVFYTIFFFLSLHSLWFLNCYALSCSNVDIASFEKISLTTKTLISILLLNFHSNLCLQETQSFKTCHQEFHTLSSNLHITIQSLWKLGKLLNLSDLSSTTLEE